MVLAECEFSKGYGLIVIKTPTQTRVAQQMGSALKIQVRDR